MFIEQNVLVRGTPNKPQGVPVSLSPMMIRHYEAKGREMSNELVQFLGLFRVSSTLIDEATEDILTLRLQSTDLALVDAFIRTFLSRDETSVAVFEGNEISMV